LIVFDVDGTILPGTSCEKLFVRYLLKKRILRANHWLNFCRRGISLVTRGLPYVTKANKGYLRGFSCDYMVAEGRRFFDEVVIPRVSRRGIERIRAHQSKGERVILFSGMPDFLLENLSDFLEVGEYYGSVMEIREVRFTGRTLGPFPLSRGKITALEMIMRGAYPGSNLSREDGNVSQTPVAVDWQGITFYGDHWLDRFLLRKVGRPVVVNPGEKLRKLAELRGWPVEEFN
jgi:phosphoserine phosphatase